MDYPASLRNTPTRSPVLNPIEHVWPAMGRHMPDLERLRTRAAVIGAALEAWEQLRRAPGQPFTAELEILSYPDDSKLC